MGVAIGFHFQAVVAPKWRALAPRLLRRAQEAGEEPEVCATLNDNRAFLISTASTIGLSGTRYFAYERGGLRYDVAMYDTSGRLFMLHPGQTNASLYVAFPLAPAGEDLFFMRLESAVAFSSSGLGFERFEHLPAEGLVGFPFWRVAEELLTIETGERPRLKTTGGDAFLRESTCESLSAAPDFKVGIQYGEPDLVRDDWYAFGSSLLAVRLRVDPVILASGR